MSDEPTDLTQILLRRVHEVMARMDQRLGNMETEMVNMRQHLALIGTEMAHERASRASIEVRLDRIERRLDLREGVS